MTKTTKNATTVITKEALISVANNDIIRTEEWEGVTLQGRFEDVLNFVRKYGITTELVEDTEDDLPPIVRQDWKGGRVNPTQYASPSNPLPERKTTVVVENRPEDGVIHTRAQGKTYPRRRRDGKPDTQCKSWTAGEHDKLAGLVCSGNLSQLQVSLVKNGMPAKSTIQKVASVLNRPESAVTAKLRTLRKKALVTVK